MIKITGLFFLVLLCSHHALCAFPIEHWIVLMMENRSFDHLLGFLKRDKNSNIDGLMGGETNPYKPSDPNSPKVTVNSNSPYVDPNAGHSYQSTRLQIFGTSKDHHPYPNPPPMNGFVADAEDKEKGWGPEVLSCFNYSSLPVLTTLALEYGMIDKWYSSLPGPTEPNRAFLHSCSSNGYLDNNEFELGVGFPQRTMFTALGDAGFTWKVYYDDFPSALFMRELREYPFNFHGTSQFVADCKSGNLPFYTFVEPSYFSLPTTGPANDQHPDHNVEDGERFIKKIYEAIRSSPLWNKTAFIITYDEHGGYYDHAPTPVVGVPNPDGIISAPPFNFTFDRLGIRVPAVIVSPWVQKGALVHEPEGPESTSQFEHCSVAATLKKIYNIPKLPLNKRDAWAGTFETMFTDLTSPRTDCPMVLPDPPAPRADADLPPHKRSLPTKPLNDLQQGMVETVNYYGGKLDDISLLKTEHEGGYYILDRLSKILEEKKQAIRRKQAVQSDNEL